MYLLEAITSGKTSAVSPPLLRFLSKDLSLMAKTNVILGSVTTGRLTIMTPTSQLETQNFRAPPADSNFLHPTSRFQYRSLASLDSTARNSAPTSVCAGRVQTAKPSPILENIDPVPDSLTLRSFYIRFRSDRGHNIRVHHGDNLGREKSRIGLTIPSSGKLRVKCLGIPHQKSIYMVSHLNALSNKQYNYK